LIPIAGPFQEHVTMHRRVLLVGILVAIMAHPAMGQRKRLEVGDAAPGLDVKEWVKGEETGIAKGTPYVVEFWATWCGPCRKSIPHLTELQHQYAEDDLRVIGVTGEEEIDKVKRFVRGQGNKMDYTVVQDNRNRTNSAWMRAAGQEGIPCAFIVDRNSNIQFIGHPMDPEFEEILEGVVSGRFDAKMIKKGEPHRNAANNARKIKNWALWEKHSQDCVDIDEKVFAEVMLDRFEVLLLDRKLVDQAYAYAMELAISQQDDPEFLTWVSTMIAQDPRIPDADRRLDVAIMLATAARANARAGDPRYLAAEAVVRFHNGEIDQAVDLQKQAYFRATAKRKSRYLPALESYKDARNLQASTG
jgi:thiol-disulfide isomerase/thioredoxin